jgi:hypothetical protein
MSDRPSVTIPGKVEKIIQSLTPPIPEKAQITIQGAEELFREIRIENKLMNKNGDEVHLKQGADLLGEQGGKRPSSQSLQEL